MSATPDMHEVDCLVISVDDYNALSAAVNAHGEEDCILDDLLGFFHNINGEYVALQSAVDTLEVPESDLDMFYSLSMDYRVMNFSTQTWNKFFN